MFSSIAGRYDFLNHLLSFQMDRHWRGVVAWQFRHRLNEPGARVLDLCCGTGDLALALARQGQAQFFCSDFSHPMLTRAGEKLRQRSLVPLVAEADALQLPFPDDSFDIVVCSFGFRNLANYRAGLREIHRVLRAGGEVGILEFSEPRGLLRPLYSFYLHRILPRVGEWVSGVKGSYSYLPGSVDRFPEPEELIEWMREASFAQPRSRHLTGGIVTLYLGSKTAG
ncbi:MAG: ubiquinone/menaquinone biosynthesis methyltransferase [Acidobacteria bacterium]|nr:ubiquinone/menaquinone biosynthesis methyltransferase [Acidobacteriota bacterium]